LADGNTAATGRQGFGATKPVDVRVVIPIAKGMTAPRAAVLFGRQVIGEFSFLAAMVTDEKDHDGTWEEIHGGYAGP
jgi:hypothetical protein